MPVAVSHHPTRHKVEGHKSVNPFVAIQDQIYSFRSIPFTLAAHWTEIDHGIAFLGLSRDPQTLHVQTKFPANTNLTVSDNFSIVVSVVDRSHIVFNVWRVDSSDNPAIQYAFDFLITLS